MELSGRRRVRFISAKVVSCCVDDIQKIMQHSPGYFPFMFGNWAGPVVHTKVLHALAQLFLSLPQEHGNLS